MRRISVLFALLAVCAPCLRGQDFRVTAKAHCEPATSVVSEPCAIILELDVDRQASLANVEVRGLPEGEDGSTVYGKFENLADGTSATQGRVVKRMRIPVRFLKPGSFEASPLVGGEVRFVKSGPGYSSVSSQNFWSPVETLRFDVQPLPKHGRPASFSGAVGRLFEIKQALDRDQVRPNDLVTATYTLTFNGYCPSNVCPNLEYPSKDFKVYPPKKVERTNDRVVWKQDLVPLTAQSTNTALVTFSYYNPQAKRYEEARAEPLTLTFVSAEAASTENTNVSVTDSADAQGQPAEGGGESSDRPVVLRFAPSEGSPVIAKLPPGTPVKELATWNGWRRLETPRAIGWEKVRK